MTFEEIQIPVPWGFVAGKSWGNNSEKLIVTLHGFQDNANSFDNLIPFLPKSFHYKCFDLPSHGKSSHLITKSMPSVFDFVLTLKLILDHLNQKKYILMGHSFGAQAIILYTQMYPERVEKLICLDTAYYLPIEPDIFINRLRQTFRLYSKLHNLNNDTAPAYALEVAAQKMKAARIVPITDEAATALLQRTLEPAGDDKYKFTLAQHLKYMIWPPFSLQYEVELIKAFPVKCPHLLIMASNTKPWYDFLHEVLQAYKTTNKWYEAYTVEGTHDAHIENPELVATYINKFLINTINKL